MNQKQFFSYMQDDVRIYININMLISVEFNKKCDKDGKHYACFQILERGPHLEAYLSDKECEQLQLILMFKE